MQVLKFLGLLLLGMAIYTLNIIYPIPSLGLFLLPIIPLVRLAYPEYGTRPVQAAVEVVLGHGCRRDCLCRPHPRRVLVFALDLGWRGCHGRADDRVLGPGTPRRSARLKLNDGVRL